MDRRRSPQYAASNGGNEIKASSTRRRGNAVVPLASPPGSLQQSHACPHGIRRAQRPQWQVDAPGLAGLHQGIEVFSFMTTLPNAQPATINHERSPVLLNNEE
jgi:hypothetical protein